MERLSEPGKVEARSQYGGYPKITPELQAES